MPSMGATAEKGDERFMKRGKTRTGKQAWYAGLWRRILRGRFKKQLPSITHECMSAMVKARSISGPYADGMSLRAYARAFLSGYQDGDFRAKSDMPGMSVPELNALKEAARWE